MPILVKDYTWKQSSEKILIRVPLKGVSSSKVDVFVFDNFIKAHYPPFLFEICLRDLINEEKSKCQKCRNEIIFELIKLETGPWDVLEAPLTKSEILAVKQNAIEVAQKRCEENKKKTQEKKSTIQRKAVQDQIALDTKEREHIDSLKEQIKSTTMNELEKWRLESKERSKESLTIKEIFDDNDIDYNTNENDELKNETCNKNIKSPSNINENSTSRLDKNIFDEPNKVSIRANMNQRTVRYNDIKPKPPVIPVPRNPGKITVSFTPRVFPTPSRESKLEEENEWLQKQAEARRKTGFVIEDLRPEEHDPVWLKDKGDSFYKVGNYLGAISAYSHGINLNPDIPTLYCNRAAAHLALGNVRRVIQDTSKAIELLTPHVEMNRTARSVCHARRGMALCQLNMLKSGLVDLEEALKLCPDDKELEEDIKKVQERLENPLDEEKDECLEAGID